MHLRPANHPQILPFELPDDHTQLLQLYSDTNQYLARMCILAKLKQQLIIHSHQINIDHLSQSSLECNSFDNSWSPKSITPIHPYTHLIIKFLRSYQRLRAPNRNEMRLLFHVISLGVKLLFNEQDFKELFNRVTDVMDSSKEKVAVCLQFCQEVVETMEESTKGKCQFERYFVSSHLNSMLTIGNFFMERYVVKNNTVIEDNMEGDRFRLKGNEQTILAIVQLIKSVLAFDFGGEKSNDQEERNSLIIPTKAMKQANFSEYEKWIKNTDWIQMYQFIILNCKSTQLKVTLIDLLGDMARVHMRYFKTKPNYRTHIQNILVVINNVLQHLDATQNIDQFVTITLALAHNLNKMTSPSILPLFFELNKQLTDALLENLKIVVIDEIIGEKILNSNLLSYIFQFFGALYQRTKFQRYQQPSTLIDGKMRQICRVYESFLSGLMSKALKGKERSSMSGAKRLDKDFQSMRQIVNSYDIPAFQVYILPFKIQKPKTASLNNISELMIYVCCKVESCVAILQSHKLEKWEGQLTINGIEQCIAKIEEWYSYTAFAKKDKHDQTHLEANSEITEIKEEYEEESIQNEAEYCHLLRFICMFILRKFEDNRKPIIVECNSRGALFRFCSLILALCFESDLQQKDSRECLDKDVRIRLQNLVESTEELLQTLLLNFFQQYAKNLSKCSTESSYRFQIQDYDWTNNIGVKIVKLAERMKDLNLKGLKSDSLVRIQFVISYYSCIVAEQSLKDKIIIQQIFVCQQYLKLIAHYQIFKELISKGDVLICEFLEQATQFIRKFEPQANQNEGFICYLRCLGLLMQIGTKQLKDEIESKVYLLIKCFLDVFEEVNLEEETIQQLVKLEQKTLAVSNHTDIIILHIEFTTKMNNSERYKQKNQEQYQVQERKATAQIMLEEQMDIENNSTYSNNAFFCEKKEKEDEGDKKKKEDKKIQNEESKEQNDFEQPISSGNHRKKTLSVIQKYSSQFKPQQQSKVSVQNKQDFDTNELSNHKEDHDEKRIQPMQIESIVEKCYIEDIRKMAKNGESHLSAYIDSQDLGMKSINQEIEGETTDKDGIKINLNDCDDQTLQISQPNEQVTLEQTSTDLLVNQVFIPSLEQPRIEASGDKETNELHRDRE